MPRGRPITNNSPLAQYKREWMRKRRAELRATTGPEVSAEALETALKNWTRNEHHPLQSSR